MFHTSTKFIKKIKYIQLFILIIIIAVITYFMNNSYNKALEKSTDKLNERIINYYFEILEHTSEKFLKDTNNHFIAKVTGDKDTRQKLEETLYLIRVSAVKNLFVITKDTDKQYYFLLDSETDSQKHSEIFEPFSPESDIWDICYKTQKAQIYKHHNNKNLWVSVAYPLVENNTTIALFAIDLSYTLDTNMQMSLKNFKTLFLGLMGISISWFVFLYISTLYFRKKYYEGYIDPLTEVYNRRYLNDILLKHLSRSYQLYMIDIDHFKKVNDTYGHDAGDYILKKVAKRIKNLMREDDIFIRFGGEEFLVYTSDLDATQSKIFAERLRKVVEEKPIIHKSISCHISISIGINPYAKNIYDFQEMLKYADNALYQAKSAGRNCVKVYKAMNH